MAATKQLSCGFESVETCESHGRRTLSPTLCNNKHFHFDLRIDHGMPDRGSAHYLYTFRRVSQATQNSNLRSLMIILLLETLMVDMCFKINEFETQISISDAFAACDLCILLSYLCKQTQEATVCQVFRPVGLKDDCFVHKGSVCKFICISYFL